MSGLRILCLSGSILLLFAPCRAAAQGTNRRARPPRVTAQSGTRIEIANNAGPPGSVVVLPIYFTPGKGVQVGTLKLQISFPAATLKFIKAERGALLKSVELSSEVTASTGAKGTDTSTVNIIASVADPGNTHKTIPAGMLASLSLRIGDKAKHGLVPLRANVEAAEPGTNRELSDVRVNSPHVQVQWVDAPPSVTCFFFSH